MLGLDSQVMICDRFNDPPFDVAIRVAKAMVVDLCAHEKENQGCTAERAVPFLLPLEKCSPAEKNYPKSLVEALQSGLREWKEKDFTFEPDDFFNQLLESTVRFDIAKIHFIVYCPASLDMMSYKEIGDRLGCLLKFLNNRRNGLTFIASDHHHSRMLAEYLNFKESQSALAG